VRHQHDEFIAAQAGREVGRAQLVAADFGRGLMALSPPDGRTGR
jgi:hypothetical protein